MMQSKFQHSLNSSYEGVTYSNTQVRMLSIPGSDISYNACYVVYSLVLLLTVNLHSVI